MSGQRSIVGIAESNISHLRKLNYLEPPPIHSSIVRWKRRKGWAPNAPCLWKNIWNLMRSEKENLFCGKLYTKYQLQMHGGTLTSQETTQLQCWCTRCHFQAHKDVSHLLWWCLVSLPIWSWATSLVQHATMCLSIRGFNSTSKGTIGRTPSGPPKYPFDTVRVIKGACCWILWKSRCTLVMEGQSTTLRGIIN